MATFVNQMVNGKRSHFVSFGNASHNDRRRFLPHSPSHSNSEGGC